MKKDPSSDGRDLLLSCSERSREGRRPRQSTAFPPAPTAVGRASFSHLSPALNMSCWPRTPTRRHETDRGSPGWTAAAQWQGPGTARGGLQQTFLQGREMGRQADGPGQRPLPVQGLSITPPHAAGAPTHNQGGRSHCHRGRLSEIRVCVWHPLPRRTHVREGQRVAVHRGHGCHLPGQRHKATRPSCSGKDSWLPRTRQDQCTWAPASACLAPRNLPFRPGRDGLPDTHRCGGSSLTVNNKTSF